MIEPANNPWLQRFTVLTAMATLSLIVIGGLVTSHGAGMAVPDWPNTYGYNMFAFPFSKWVGGILFEHSHRLVASLVGLLTAILALWLWARETRSSQRWVGIGLMLSVLVLMGIRSLPVYIILASLAPLVILCSIAQIRRNPPALRWWGVIAFAAVVLQGVLGGLRVVWLADQIGIFHATLAQLFFVLLCAIALFTSKWWQVESGGTGRFFPGELNGRKSGRPSTAMWIALLTAMVLIGLQLVVGATMRHQHAGLAIPDFPLAYGKLWPPMDAGAIAQYNQQRLETIALNPITAFQVLLQMAHRIIAVLVLLAVAWCGWLAWRHHGARAPVTRGILLWLGLILAQGFLGAITILSNKAADIATAHVLFGAVTLALGTMLCIIYSRGPGLAQQTAPAKALTSDLFGSKPSAVTGLK